jgi:hypothetical protein
VQFYLGTALAWYAEFLLEIDLKILLRKIGARLIFKIALISLHIDPELQTRPDIQWFSLPTFYGWPSHVTIQNLGLIGRVPSSILRFRFAPVFSN